MLNIIKTYYCKILIISEMLLYSIINTKHINGGSSYDF